MKLTFLIIVIAFVIFFFSDDNQAFESIDFGYSGSKGPNSWHFLSNESAICETGRNQSPIDITLEDLKTLAKPPPAKFKDAKNVKAINNGNTVEISSGWEGVPLPAEISIEGVKYTLQQFHFHTPSEHRINGRHSDVEQHLVFKDENENISVVSILYDVGKYESEFMKPISMHLPKEIDDEVDIEEVKLSKLLNDIDHITKAYTYSGSLTTPPCTEGVTWYVNKDTLSISFDQFIELKDVIGFNSRFTQLREEDFNNVGIPGGVVDEIPTLKKRSLYHSSRFRK